MNVYFKQFTSHNHKTVLNIPGGLCEKKNGNTNSYRERHCHDGDLSESNYLSGIKSMV